MLSVREDLNGRLGTNSVIETEDVHYMTVKIGCDLLSDQLFYITLLVQAWTEKRSDSYRLPHIDLETRAEFSDFLRSVKKTMRTADSAEDEEEERVVRGE